MPNCLVSGTIVRANDAPVIGAVVGWRLDAPSNSVVFVGGKSVSSSDEFVLCTDENGEWSVNLEQGSKMVVRIEELDLYRQVTIPAQATASLEEVLNADV